MTSKFVWNVIHFGVALAIPIVLIFLVSCKQAHEEKAPLGPQVDPSVIDGALAQAIDGASIADLQVNQSAHYQLNRRIANQDPTLDQGNHDLQVIDRHDDPNTQETVITIHQNQRIRKADSFENVESESTLTTPMPSLTAKIEAGAVPGIAATTRDTQPVNVTYHNFSTSKGDATPPDNVANRTGCGGLSPCTLHLTYISFDVAYWYNSEDYDKVHFDYAFTNQLPFMGDLLGVMAEGCAAQYVTVGNNRYFVRDCKYLTDFQK